MFLIGVSGLTLPNTFCDNPSFPFFAKEVNIVTAGKAELTILLDGNPISSEYAGMDVLSGKLQVEEPGLYNIITSEEATSHTLEIQVSESGFEMYTFTFG